ncbi:MULTISPECIES: heme o synthase [Pseudomonas]|uniref:heme o synthase n=1 Tax=Pseudomonas nitroreducens TaxID=46680 RepID=UPI00147EEE17|nr:MULTISPECIES: heme o synthase [Pseudomonas]NNN26875.1 protoheme IX farnesyltransferase [Pseudomonas nitroreducens]
MKLKRYLLVAKPGIIFGNLIAVAGGYFLAARGSVDPMLLLATVIGLSLVVASGCVFNNCIDRDIDRFMERTRSRVTVTGQISLKAALAHGVVLGAAGFGLLAWKTNMQATLLAAFGFFVYVVLYSLWLKRASVYGTLVGSLSGAMPPVVGYCAASGHFDMGAAVLLLIFCLWQMPHSYAIAIFRLNDYRAAGIPVLPVERGIEATKKQILYYVLAFGLATLLLTVTGFAGYGYLVVALAVSAWWLFIAVKGFSAEDDRRWARQLFAFSIIAISVLSLMMSIDFQAIPAQSMLAAL